MSEQWKTFQVGDVVTRDGTDLHRIIEMNGPAGEADLIEVECIREPLGYLQEDGVSRGDPWTRLGERDWNVPWRYEYPDDLTVNATVQRDLSPP